MKLKNLVSEILWDKGNLKALSSYINDGPKQKFTITVKEPFKYETTDEQEYYALRQALYNADAKFDLSTEDI